MTESRKLDYNSNLVRVSIDVVLFMSLIFASGASYQKIVSLEYEIASLRAQVQTSDNMRLDGYQRLARVETKLDSIVKQLDRLESRQDGR